MNTVAEAVLIAFMIGAIVGGVVATHLVTKKEIEKAQRTVVKVKSK
ncbi:MAG: hypothetical protein OEX00_01875 [Gammaproteobacteria bacterium]|nr:hypothetical protein [Gammaproteobacteria bacterium]MDH5693990.1 hypothetical protein [Gammaproteobacteria bacterium]